MKTFNKTLLVAALIFAGFSSNAIAADGTIGATSSGSSLVTIIKDNVVLISGVTDINLGTESSLAADKVASGAACVFNSTGGYNVTLTSANAALALTSASSPDTIPYTFSWTADGAAASPMAYGSTSIGHTGDSTSLNCGSSTNASFEVTVAAAAFNSVFPGTYTDTLILEVAPE